MIQEKLCLWIWKFQRVLGRGFSALNGNDLKLLRFSVLTDNLPKHDGIK